MAWISKVTRGQGTSIVDPDMVIVDSEDEVVSRYKIWHSISDINAVGSSYLQSNENGAYLQLSFKGSALWVRFRLGPDCGKAKVIVDDEERYIDLYSDTHVFAYVNVAVGLSPDVDHTVKIEVTDSKNPSSTNYYVRVDSFAYRTAEQAISQWGVEYIDLINTINTINTINKIVTIQNVSSIGEIDTIRTIESIEKIKQAQWIANLGVVMNGGFETGDLTGWVDPGNVATVTSEKVAGGRYSCNLKHGDTGIIQYFYPPILIDDVVESTIMVLQGDLNNDKLTVMFYFTDGKSGGFTLPSNSIANDWQIHNLASKIRSVLIETLDLGGKYFYAIELRNSGTTDTLYIDDFTLRVAEGRLMQNCALLNDVSVAVLPNSSDTTPVAGYVPVTPRQNVCVSLEYKTDCATDVVARLHVVWYNKDKSVNQDIDYADIVTLNEYRKKSFWLRVPEGVAYLGLYGYAESQTGAHGVTLYIRNIRVFPVSFQVDSEGRQIVKCEQQGEWAVKISGETVVAEVSGQTVIGKVSGETVDIVTPTVVKTYATRVISSVSGGEPLHSGAVKSVIIKALGTFYVGGDQNGYYPYSGYGFLMVSGEALNLDVDDFSRVRLFAVNSGEMVTFLGVY